jgi:hypothetical protein
MNFFRQKSDKYAYHDKNVEGKIAYYEKKAQDLNLGKKNNIVVHIFYEEQEVYISSGEDTFYFESTEEINLHNESADFAVWLFLPVAMSSGKHLVINGSGTEDTKRNAERMTEIWSSWVPSKFSIIDVDFKTQRDKLKIPNRKQLMFFSGGIDSTYSLITKDFNNELPTLLTIQGKDYNLSDNQGFINASIKTDILASKVSSGRIYMKSNAKFVHNKYKIPGAISYVFSLAAAGFLHIKNYKTVTMASDFPNHQQFILHPYGSNFATDRLFDSGDFKIETHGETFTRAEKLPSIAKNDLAVKSISFCKNKQVRPENCGLCSKCMRTKYMFLAAIGSIPENIFIDPQMDGSRKIKFSRSKDIHLACVRDAYCVAYRNGNLDKVPQIVKEYERTKRY